MTEEPRSLPCLFYRLIPSQFGMELHGYCENAWVGTPCSERQCLEMHCILSLCVGRGPRAGEGAAGSIQTGLNGALRRDRHSLRPGAAQSCVTDMITAQQLGGVRHCQKCAHPWTNYLMERHCVGGCSQKASQLLPLPSFSRLGRTLCVALRDVN